jgi:hypothetical protein
MKMKPPSGPKKQTQNKPNFFKGQNRLPENPATPPSYTLRQLFDIIVLYEYHS